MEFNTTTEWNERHWKEAEPVYEQAFPAAGRKNPAIIRRMLERGIGQLHTAVLHKETIAMALTGHSAKGEVTIIDYLAVDEAYRNQGVGRRLIDYIRAWSGQQSVCRGIVIEVEAEPTEANLGRIRFWERNGFRLTDDVHQYIWVPEPYRAMILHLTEANRLPEDGKTLFRYITSFHERAYRSKS